MAKKLEENPYYIKAQEFIKNNDLTALEDGKHVLDGTNLYINVKEYDLKTPDQAVFEVHDEYYDIQVPLTAPEGFGLCPREELKQPQGEFNREKDVQKFTDPVTKIVTVQPGEQITFEPHEGHAPLIGEGKCRVAIFKVKIV